MESEIKNPQNGNNVLPAPETPKKRHKPNIFSTIFIWWMCPVLINGNKRDVEEEDLITPSKAYDSERQGDYFERYWLAEVERAASENREPSLWSAMRRAYWVQYMPSAIYILIITTARTAQPLVFAELLSYWSVDSTMSTYDAGFYALAMLGLNFISLMCQHHNSLFVVRFGMKVKVACSSLLYRKLLRLSQVSVGEVAGGKLVNLLSNDIARFDYAFMFLHYLWIVPIQAAVVLYFLYDVAGYAPFVGLFGVVIFILPLQAALTKLTAVIRRSTAKRTDKRIKLMNEIINGIQVIKMYAWEKPFQLVVKLARAYEMTALKKSIFVRSMFLGFMLFTERSIMFFTILTLALTGTMISATIIYPIQQFFSIIQMNVTLILPLAIASFSEMLVSCERIQSFLILEERSDMQVTPKIIGGKNKLFNSKNGHLEPGDVLPKKYVPSELSVTKPAEEPVQSDYPIVINRVSASWTGSNKPEDVTLKNISMRVRKGKLCAVIGPVGSGKTSLLQLLLRELPLMDGTLNVKGKLSYACQESWLFPGTVRENILFGLPYDVKKYKEVCKAACLVPDFKQFPYGDLSLVGERGVSLSGGQRARINLARAIYREADIYLLDDPLSAVDANVGRQLFDGCIKGYLAGRTCVLVTHQIHYLKTADYIVVLHEGAIENMGSYDELAKSGTEFSNLLSDQAGNSDVTDVKTNRPAMLRGISKISVKSQEEQDEEEKAQVLEAEERGTGSLKFEVIWSYIKAVQSWTIVILALVSLMITQGAATTADYWLSFWTNQVSEYEISLEPGQLPDTSLDAQIGLLTTAQYLIVLGSVIGGIIIISHLRILAFVVMTMRASQNLHNIIYEQLIIAVMRFFDTNPSGRVLNRFSKDMGAMDELLPRSILETIQMYLSLASVLILNAIALPWTLIPTAVLLVVFVFFLRWYISAAQAVKRLEGTTKSPVFGMISSTISGLSTIRSSDSQTRLLRTFDSAQDLHTSAFYTFMGGSTAFGMYLDAMCLAYLGVVLAIFLLGDFSDIIPVGSVGLAVSQSMVLTLMLQMAARFTADFLGQMTAVERVLDYTKLPSEENMETGPTTPPNDWPKVGQVAFNNVYLNYSPDDPPVLKNLNFVIQSGWKVGVVGRTGAGKSSLISALFRLSNITGHITIDGLDTEGIAKKVLRSKISIIPQEPVLFSATLRYNLDPFNDYSDEDIWRALEQVELKDGIQSLEFKVTEGGSNFSMGQRQLICLARAVLRSNKILIMDEATANVDPQTDALIQTTIRREFAACTVLTIAHRLNTIMDSDRVLVMDKGEAVEFDHPHILLSNPNSVFSSMVRETGENMAKILFDVAKDKYDSDNKKA
ncbi:unnamed protein product [Chrysodeixis includens]|uniref:ATP-binding cassette transporter subfamily C2 n=1 Tax=Chrysodeixis includens TaxID=689277 RepID=A0A894I6D7_CHRIL|nr:ATP-binding cassette transporter subfamily C2 [Chrysodeixis includens]CAH0600505.1 unnamed protein product [Chrysodeixis includens]